VQDIYCNERIGKYFSVSRYSPEPLKFATLSIDITEQKQAELMLRSKKHLLQQSYAELSALYEKVVVTNEQLAQSQTTEDIFHADPEVVDVFLPGRRNMA